MLSRITTGIFLTFLTITVSLLSFQYTNAQGFSLYSERDIFVETTPNIPGPNEDVTIELNSYSFNLNNYYIAWFEDGTQRSADYGNRTYTFRTGNSGSVTNITAVVEVGSQTFRKELRYSPSNVDLLWEAVDVYIPPFYRGKALPLQQSTIKITAIPETQLLRPVDAPNLIYYWENNYRADSNASGFGRQSYTIEADALNLLERITVTANDRRENSFARKTVEIPTSSFEPKTLFYEIDDQSRILTQRALNTNSRVDGDEIRFGFHPLHLSSTESNFTDLFVQWNINGDPQAPQNFDRQSELFISSGGNTGNVPISVTLEHVDLILQESIGDANLLFGS